MSVVLEARGLRKTYLGGDGSPIEVLAGVELSVSRGEFVAIVGASGSGKSTLLHLLGALDRPSAGEVRLGDQAYATLTPDALAALRNRRIGFVFQFHHLLREFNARENVMMPLLIAGATDAEAGARADVLLEAVGLAAASHAPAHAALGRRAAARGGGARAGQLARRGAGGRTLRATSTTPTAKTCTRSSPGWPGSSRRRWWW